jgi:peptidoglycan/LPS O-acetylase OafA/YrhL
VAYLVLLGLGVVRLLRWEVVLGLAAGCWTFSTMLVVAAFGSSGMPLWVAPRLSLMFACGILLWLWRDHLPVSRSWAGAAAVLLFVSLFTPNYRLVAAPAVAYLCIWGSLWLGRWSRLLLRTDLSYGVYVYGFPVQQALLLSGVTLGWSGFAMLSIAAVMPMAAASWWLIERPTMRTRSTRNSSMTQPAARESTDSPVPVADPATGGRRFGVLGLTSE